MGNPNGNPGNKGGGRKSAYQERADAELLWQLFFGEMTRADVEAKIQSGTYSMKDVWLSKGLAGNERVLVEMTKKLFPDLSKVKAEVDAGFTIEVVDYKRGESSTE